MSLLAGIALAVVKAAGVACAILAGGVITISAENLHRRRRASSEYAEREALAVELRALGVYVRAPRGPVPLWSSARERGSYSATWGAS